MQRETITAKEAATYIGISYWKLLELVKAGEIPHIKLPGRILFRKKSLDEWMDRKEKENFYKEHEEHAEGVKKIRFTPRSKRDLSASINRS